jgi:hypothetical protein
MGKAAKPPLQERGSRFSVPSSALALVADIPRVGPAVCLLALVGLSGAVFNVTARTSLQRSAPSDAIGGLFSFLEGLMDLGVILGAARCWCGSPWASEASICFVGAGSHRLDPGGVEGR